MASSHRRRTSSAFRNALSSAGIGLRLSKTRLLLCDMMSDDHDGDALSRPHGGPCHES
jgi:hypothetical protein